MEEFKSKLNNEVYTEKYKKAKDYLFKLFTDKNQEGVEELYSKIREVANVAGVSGEFLIKQIKNFFELENSEEFVKSTFEILKKLIDQTIEHPEIFEKIRRERVIQEKGNIKLSELMYYSLDLENGTLIIHVAPKGELKLGEIIKAFRGGLKELAKQVKEDERIKDIQATSWIVAKNPGLLEKAGFEVKGSISEEMKAEYFGDEEKPVSWAHISREALLEKYL